MSFQADLPDIRLDAGSLYREEVFSDRQAGSIRRLIPVTADGADDASREVLYEGQTSLLTAAGTLPLNFEIDAASLQEALDKFPQAAKTAVEQTLEELRELRRQASSSIVTPGSGGGLGGGGMPGGGIKLR